MPVSAEPKLITAFGLRCNGGLPQRITLGPSVAPALPIRPVHRQFATVTLRGFAMGCPFREVPVRSDAGDGAFGAGDADRGPGLHREEQQACSGDAFSALQRRNPRCRPRPVCMVRTNPAQPRLPRVLPARSGARGHAGPCRRRSVQAASAKKPVSATSPGGRSRSSPTRTDRPLHLPPAAVSREARVRL